MSKKQQLVLLCKVSAALLLALTVMGVIYTHYLANTIVVIAIH